MTGAVASWVMRLIWAPGRSGSARVTIQPLVHYRPQSQYVAVETLGRLQRRTAEIRDGSANTHIVVILPARFDAAGAAGRIVPEADGRVVCSLRSWPSPITTETAIRYVRGMRPGGRSDPAAGAGELDRFVAVGGAELGGCGGEVVADCAGGQGRASGDFIDGGAACGEFQDVGFAGGERAVAGADGVGGEFGVDVAAAAVDGAYHVGQDLGRDGLGQEPADAGGEGPFEMPGPSVAGQDEAAAGGQLGDQLLGDSDPVQAGHLQIQHGHVRAVPAGHREGLVARGGLSYHLQDVLDRQQGGQRGADEVLVVGEEHADHGAGVSVTPVPAWPGPGGTAAAPQAGRLASSRKWPLRGCPVVMLPPRPASRSPSPASPLPADPASGVCTRSLSMRSVTARGTPGESRMCSSIVQAVASL